MKAQSYGIFSFVLERDSHHDQGFQARLLAGTETGHFVRDSLRKAGKIRAQAILILYALDRAGKGSKSIEFIWNNQ
jgi:hypothetical protein